MNHDSDLQQTPDTEQPKCSGNAIKHHVWAETADRHN